MSRGNRARVERVGRRYYEDASDFQTISTMSRWSGVSLTCPQQVVRVGLVEFGEQHARHPRNKSRGSRACRACPRARMSRGCYEETASVELRLYAAQLRHGTAWLYLHRWAWQISACSSFISVPNPCPCTYQSNYLY